MDDSLEFRSGFMYTLPFRYKYDYKRFNTDGTSVFVTGRYKLKDNFYFPAELSYRPKDNLSISFSSDFNLISQKLVYEQKEADNSITSYPTKKLVYYNTKPALKVTYLYDNRKEKKEDEFCSLTTGT